MGEMRSVSFIHVHVSRAYLFVHKIKAATLPRLAALSLADNPWSTTTTTTSSSSPDCTCIASDRSLVVHADGTETSGLQMSLLQMTQWMIMDQFDLRTVTNHELVVHQFRTNHFYEKLSHFQGPTWTTLAAGECRYLSNGL
jgi:hypothetical protein